MLNHKKINKEERKMYHLFETMMRPSVLGKWRKTYVISDREAGKSL